MSGIYYADHHFIIIKRCPVTIIEKYLFSVHISHKTGRLLKNWNVKANKFVQNMGVNKIAQLSVYCARL